MTDLKIKLFIAGDFCPVNRVDTLLKEKKADELFIDLKQLLDQVDISIVNLECPITSSNKPLEKTGPNLKGDTSALQLLKKAGFTLLTLANNHIMDFGNQGLKDTIKELENASISYIGAGSDYEEAKRPFIFEKEGYKIGILNVTENEWSTTSGNYPGANPIDPVQNFMHIQNLKQQVNRVIVITHGGHEMYDLPSPRMKKLFRFYIDAGADAVINHHTHVFSGYEIYKGAPIMYSLGNFVFDNPRYIDSPWNIGLVCLFEITPNAIEVQPYFIEQNNKNPEIRLVRGEHEQSLMKQLQNLNSVIQNDLALEESFNKYTARVSKLYASYLEPISNRILIALINRGLFPSIWSRRKRLYLENLIRCEAHRDIVLNLLSKEK